MATTLEELIESIDPSRTIERVSSAVDEAFNSFQYNNPIRTFEDYQGYMARFVQHVEQIVLRFNSNNPNDPDFFWARYVNLVNSGYDPGAWKWNYEKVMTGKDGGLYKILQDVAAMILKDRSGREISGRILAFWNSLNTEEKLDTIDEFLRKYGYILPTEFTEGSAAHLRMNFSRFLEQYPQFLLEMRRSIR
jgi:hypothetical protein